MIRRCDEITIFPDLNLSLNDPDLSTSKCHNATGTLWHTTQPSNRDFESKEWGRSTITGTRYLWRFESTFGSQVDEAAMLEISGKWVCLKVIYHDLPQNWSMLRDLPLKITNICWVLHYHFLRIATLLCRREFFLGEFPGHMVREEFFSAALDFWLAPVAKG